MMAEEVEVKADDSDYYTPEDPHTTILSPVKSPSGQLDKVSCLKLSSFNFSLTTICPSERHPDAISSNQRHGTSRQPDFRQFASFN